MKNSKQEKEYRSREEEMESWRWGGEPVEILWDLTASSTTSDLFCGRSWVVSLTTGAACATPQRLDSDLYPSNLQTSSHLALKEIFCGRKECIIYARTA